MLNNNAVSINIRSVIDILMTWPYSANSQQVDAETKHGLPPHNRTPRIISRAHSSTSCWCPDVAVQTVAWQQDAFPSTTHTTPTPWADPACGTRHSAQRALITIDISSAPVFSDYEQRLDVVSSTIGSSRFKPEK